MKLSWCSLFLIVALPATAAFADPIIITNGSFIINADGIATWHVQGTQGFRFDGIADATRGFGFLCGCFPGEPLDPGGVFNNMLGTAQLNVDGNTHTFATSDFGPVGFGGARVTASPVVVPPLNGSSVLSSPFSFESVFSISIPELFPEGGLLLPVRGDGTARIELTPRSNGSGTWQSQGGTYDFAPTPEPGTLTLLSIAVATAVVWRRRHAGDRITT